ncbi:hypothetical protein ALC62_12930, partial [Cyphomyrmex costatus]
SAITYNYLTRTNIEGRRNRCTRQRDARRTPLDFGMIMARNPSSRSAPRTMIGGRESLRNSPTMGSRPIENTIWRAQVYSKAIRTRSHEFTLIRLGIYVIYRIYYFEHDSGLFFFFSNR